MTKICCIGAGYVGTPTMAVMCKYVEDVEIYVADIDERKIQAWNSDHLPVYEPGLKPLVEEHRGNKLHFTTDVKTAIQFADIIFIAVNISLFRLFRRRYYPLYSVTVRHTPTKVCGEGSGSAADLKYIESAARSIAACAQSDKIIVEKSTVPVQTAYSVERILSLNSKYHFDVLSNPEFLAEGTAIHDLESPSRVLIGGQPTPEGEKAMERVCALYRHWVPEEKILKMTIWSSELSKLVSNAFLAQRVSSINSISALCECIHGDVTEISRAIGMDPRIGSRFLQASIGFGGSCFAKDIKNLVYICRRHGLSEVADYWESVLGINEFQTKRFVHEMVMRMFQNVTNKKVTLFGFAFKADTGDCRETPAAYVTKYLSDEKADLHVYDPAAHREEMLGEICRIFGSVDEKQFHTHTDPYEAAKGAHCIAILTEWEEFKTLDYQKLFDAMEKPAFFFDGRNLLDPRKLQKIGFEVYSIGRGDL